MTTIVTVAPATTPAEVLICLMERDAMGQYLPAPDSEWRLVATVEPGETRKFYAHSRKAVIVRDAPV